MLQTGLAATEAVAVCLVVAVIGNFKHYTWWAVAAYGCFLVGTTVGYASQTCVCCFVIQTMVIAGVLVMSIAQCHMLQDAAVTHGPAAYLTGNFLLHYWPCIGTVLRADTPVCAETQGSVAILLFLVYCSLWHPNSVYGCSISYNVVVVGATTSGLLASSIAVRHACIFGDGSAV